MADWLLPTEASQYLDVLQQLKERDTDNATMFVSNPINPVTGTLRFVRGAQFILQEYDGAIWNDKVLSVASGGTGSTNMDDVKASLNLGTMSNQNYNTVNITGGNITGISALGATQLTLTSGTPIFVMYSDTAAVDWKRWQWYATSAGDYVLSLTNDANTVANTFLHFKRNGLTPTYLDVNAYLGVRVIPNTTSYAYIQVGGSTPTIATIENGAIFSSNLYVHDLWRHFTNGHGGMIRFLDGNVDIYVTDNNAGGPGAGATLYQLVQFNAGGTAIYKPTTLVSNVSINGDLTLRTNLQLDGWMNIGGYNAVLGASIVLNQSPHIYPGILFRGSGGNFAHILATTTNQLIIRMTAGVEYIFENNIIRPSNNFAVHLGYPGYYFNSAYALYFQSSTGYGFIFDGTASRGLTAIGGSMALVHDNAIHITANGNTVYSAIYIPPFATWANAMSHIIPSQDYAFRIGFNAPYRWFQAHIYHGVVSGSADRSSDTLGAEPLGLQFINALEPVMYRRKVAAKGLPNPVNHGFAGSKLRQVLDTLNVEFGGLVEDEQGEWGLNYSELIAPIIKAIQELSRKVDEYGSRNHD